MANTSSAKKAVRKLARRTAINRMRRSAMRTQLRKVEEAIASGDAAAARTALTTTESVVMRSAQKGNHPRQYGITKGVAPLGPREGLSGAKAG